MILFYLYFLKYTDFNQTVKVETFDGNVQINRYDAEGLRYEMEENGQLVQFIFNTDREVIAEQEKNKWTVYIRGSELLASSNDHARTYYHYATDEMGSITYIVDDKNILNQYEYDVWGNVVNQKETIKNRFKFNGQQLDPITQQYYLRSRFYNPVIARFTQEDTYRGDGLNLYAYCRNNPIYYTDPTGNAVCQSKFERYKEIRNKFGVDAQKAKKYMDYLEAKSSGLTSVEAYAQSTGKNPLSKLGAETLGKDVFNNFNIDNAYVKPKHLAITGGSGGKFLGDSKNSSEDLLKNILRDGDVIDISNDGVSPLNKLKYKIIIDAKEIIGTKGETLVRIVLSQDGGMITALPVKSIK